MAAAGDLAPAATMRSVTDDPRINSYLATLPPDQQEALGRVRAELHRLVLDAEESISYGMPVIKRGGQGVLWFAGWKKHCNIYPLTDSFLVAHEAELESYGRTKGSLHFTPEAPLPPSLFEAIVKARLADLDAGV